MRTLLVFTLSLVAMALAMAGCAPEAQEESGSTEGELRRKPPRNRDAGAAVVDAAPPPECASFTYSDFGACQPDNTQTRTTITASPSGCAGGTPVLSQACAYVPALPATCTSFMYSAFGPCQPDSTQTRTVTSSLPDACTGGTPVLSQACTYTPPVVTCTSFTYTAFGACQPNSTQTRTTLSSSPAGCTGGTPVVSQACTYVPPPPATCSSFTYTDFGACQPNNTQTRTVLSASPMGCVGGAPALSQACTYTPPGARDYKSFDGSSLTTNRTVAALGVDRGRVKPYSALQTEYPRVLATTPASLSGAGPTFGVPPNRWYEEPSSSAVELKKAFDIGFDGCLTYTATATRFGAAPTTATATTECTAMGLRFWSRTPSAAQLSACVNVATTATATEPDPRRKWAYTCATMLIDTGFLTY